MNLGFSPRRRLNLTTEEEPSIETSNLCNRRKKEATEYEDMILTAKEQAARKKFDYVLAQGCPQCGRVDMLTRQGSSHLIHNLRCNRCNLRLAWFRVGK